MEDKMRKTFLASFFIAALAFSSASFGDDELDMNLITQAIKEGKISQQEANRMIEEHKKYLKWKIEQKIKSGPSTEELMGKAQELQAFGDEWKRRGNK